jgi:hypothetical protein
MSLSLHSAPRFDAQHLQAELNALTEEEIEECNRDVHGTNGNEEDEENNQEEEDDEDEEESEASSSSRQRPPATTGPVIQESPEFLRLAIEDLHQLLLSLEQNPLDQFEEGTPLEIEAYQLALLTCPDYVNSDSFRLMFLRAMQFDIPMTAKRIVVYWSRKVELFGTDRAFHKLTIQDLLDAEGDPRVFERVGIRALPLLDHAGRGLVLSCRAEWPNFSVVGRGLSIVRLFLPCQLKLRRTTRPLSFMSFPQKQWTGYCALHNISQNMIYVIQVLFRILQHTLYTTVLRHT